MKFAIAVFPGSNCEADTHHVLTSVMGQQAEYVWHATEGRNSLDGYDCVVLPGGFAHGDYLRVGAIAAISPVMEAVRAYAERGGLVLGICNGFQILLEAQLLPGAIQQNRSLQFRSQWVHLRVENDQTPFTRAYERGQVVNYPVSHGDGSYFADAATLAELETNGQVVFRYCDAQGNVTPEANPNGSSGNIAGIRNRRGNVLGLMPHPERCCEPILGGTDGKGMFESVVNALVTA
ncbi:MAG: Phosphoribosylformylglycinamidine synthase, glutamine amidotransferase subunit [uncultured Chloroflexi bacterium]|uniref:Phosphoribosylformylglycinamidine synthase subunit PurQ n=1 Tax=uncultured Chloroflexota bacterium TaxID=166587 RepID=A0A6J4H0F0_9CHLR|nr:MAG: Phosphoribosylformylglycinamidine synthase, glutamine amidotransferase subunit [uncultured Chloroflexota bacterium]